MSGIKQQQKMLPSWLWTSLLLTYTEWDPERSQVGHAAVCCSYINRWSGRVRRVTLNKEVHFIGLAHYIYIHSLNKICSELDFAISSEFGPWTNLRLSKNCREDLLLLRTRWRYASFRRVDTAGWPITWDIKQLNSGSRPEFRTTGREIIARLCSPHSNVGLLAEKIDVSLVYVNIFLV